MSEFIYNQHEIPRDKWRYGLRSSAATGCGWIATYNALKLLGYDPQPSQLIRYYSRRVPFYNGLFGTFVSNPAGYFRKLGFEVQTCLHRSFLNRTVEESDVCILYFWWREKWKIGAHYIALHQKDNTIMAYNVFRNSRGPDAIGPDLSEFMKKQHYFLPVLFGIRRK